MGQQQLLLVILVTIIVGIATVVAINIFGSAADEANRDAVRQDILAAAAQAQGVWAKPELMNGADRDFGGDALTTAQLLGALNIPTNESGLGEGDVPYVENDNGTYTVNPNSATKLTITGEPASGGADITGIVCRDATNGNWLVDVGSPAVDPCP